LRDEIDEITHEEFSDYFRKKKIIDKLTCGITFLTYKGKVDFLMEITPKGGGKWSRKRDFLKANTREFY